MGVQVIIHDILVSRPVHRELCNQVRSATKKNPLSLRTAALSSISEVESRKLPCTVIIGSASKSWLQIFNTFKLPSVRLSDAAHAVHVSTRSC